MASSLMALGSAREIRGQPSTPAQGDSVATPDGSDMTQLLPRETILSVDAVQEIIPEIANETETGPNVSVLGIPTANRSVTFSTADGSHHVVLSVDQFRTAGEAGRSFQAAFAATKAVPGVTTESVSDVGQAALIGVVTQGEETHVGSGALFGNLIVIATLQFYDGTDENKNKVVELIRAQAAHAKQTLGLEASATPAS